MEYGIKRVLVCSYWSVTCEFELVIKVSFYGVKVGSFWHLCF